MDNDRKIRAVSLLKCSSISLAEIDAVINSETLLTTVGSAGDDLTADDITEQLTYQYLRDTNDLNIIYYVAGYIARSVCRTTKCDSCKEALHEDESAELMECDDPLPYSATTFFDSINRGGLKRPTDFTFQMTSYSWTVYREIRDNPLLVKDFLSAECQRALFYKIMDRATCHSAISICGLNNYLCTNGHELTKLVAQRFFNCVAKNMAKEMTSRANSLTEQASQRRKINKLCSKLK
jgi:hypothetical protein